MISRDIAALPKPHLDPGGSPLNGVHAATDVVETRAVDVDVRGRYSAVDVGAVLVSVRG